MTAVRWVRLDLNYFSNPKILRVSTPAKLLHLAAICWSGSHLTDGHIPLTVIPYLLAQAGATRRHLAELDTADLVNEIDGDYLVHGYLDMQDSRQRVLENIELARERKRRWKAKQTGDTDA